MNENAPSATFRVATNADGPAVRALVGQVLVEYGLAIDPDGTDADLADIEGHYRTPGGTFEVIEVGGVIVGSWGLAPLGDGAIELRKMYLRPTARGLGLGRRSLERALAFARDAGLTRVELETASVLKEAIDLYTRYGFQPIANRHLASRCDQAMVLHLKEAR